MSDSDNPYRGPKGRPRPPGSVRGPNGNRVARPAAPAPPASSQGRADSRQSPPSTRDRPRDERGARYDHRGVPLERPASARGRAAGERARYDAEASASGTRSESAQQRPTDEVRLYGLNACRAAFAKRPQDLRKVYLSESRMGVLRDVLAYCVKQKLGYRVVPEEDLGKLASSSHHEGVVFEMRRRAEPTLDALLASLSNGPQVLIWLDGVGNPHNFGAVLRSAAHFGVAGVLLPGDSTLTLSGAAARIAEGGAESVSVVRLDAPSSAIEALKRAGFTLAATLPRNGESIYSAALPERLVLIFGAEASGMARELVDASTLRLSIPGSGRVESLNIANAVGVLLGECWRRHCV
jgi:RNA methyltransferase, TrmH family